MKVAPTRTPRCLVDDELARSLDAVPARVGAGDVAGARTTRDVEPLLPRLLLGESDRGDLRIGERDARERHVVGERGDLFAEDRVAGEPRRGTCPCA